MRTIRIKDDDIAEYLDGLFSSVGETRIRRFQFLRQRPRTAIGGTQSE